MRRLTLWIVSTIAAVVLLFSYRTSLGGAPPATATGAVPGIVHDDTASPSTTSATSRPPSGSAKTLTVNGTVADTRWGPVQVQIRITSNTITDVRVLRRPTGSDRDDEINGYALPQLRAEVLSAQSARIDTVSGATVTSDGYIQSLQAALDAAHHG